MKKPRKRKQSMNVTDMAAGDPSKPSDVEWTKTMLRARLIGETTIRTKVEARMMPVVRPTSVSKRSSKAT